MDHRSDEDFIIQMGFAERLGVSHTSVCLPEKENAKPGRPGMETGRGTGSISLRRSRSGEPSSKPAPVRFDTCVFRLLIASQPRSKKSAFLGNFR